MNTNIIEEAVPPSEQAIRNVLSELQKRKPLKSFGAIMPANGRPHHYFLPLSAA